MDSLKYVQWLHEQARLKRPYWYGTFGHTCSNSLLQAKTKQYPSHYTSGRMARYNADIAAGKVCADCVGGAIKWAMWSDLGAHKTVYASNGCPDTSADGMFRHCKDAGMEWGSMASLPEVPGVAVRFAGHVGVYVGNGEVVEWRGFAYGCVITDVKKRPWTHWYKLPWIDYAADTGASGTTLGLLGARLLKRGSRGEDVRELQSLLNKLGFDAGAPDGDFGPLTEAAVRKMQDAADIAADGKYGDKSHAALMAMIAELEASEENAPEVPEYTAVRVRVTGGTVNIRSGPGTQYDILSVARKGMLLQSDAYSRNGWYSVIINGATGWISGKYAEEVS